MSTEEATDTDEPVSLGLRPSLPPSRYRLTLILAQANTGRAAGIAGDRKGKPDGYLERVPSGRSW